MGTHQYIDPSSGVVYGVTTLCRAGPVFYEDDGSVNDSALDLSWLGPRVHTERGNHIKDLDSEKSNPGDFWHCNDGAEVSKLFAATRGISITGFRVGEKTDGNLTHSMVQNLLSINSGTTPEEQQLRYLDLAYQKVFRKMSNVRSFVSFEVSSSQSKFILMANQVPVWMGIVTNDRWSYLVWTNEMSFEDRLRAQYPDEFYFYRFRPLPNSVTVIQSFFLRKKLQKWGVKFKDRLKTFNALEQYLIKRTAPLDIQSQQN